MPADIEAWIAAATKFVPADQKESVSTRFNSLQAVAGYQDAVDVATWKSLEDSYRSSDPNGARHRQHLAEFLGDLACEAKNAPNVARSLIGRDEYMDYRLARLGDSAPSAPGWRKGVRRPKNAPASPASARTTGAGSRQSSRICTRVPPH
jgi:hypothetical protein